MPMVVEPTDPLLRRDETEKLPDAASTADGEVSGNIPSVDEFTFDSDTITGRIKRAKSKEKSEVCT